jgi:dCTP deaminase
MSIKSDNWIRRMARDHGMIEPFAAEQVRQVNGHRIVSYGTSSYGYDARCANEFKIFTNINSTIVDPKAFDEKSFVDFGGDVCIIPPNSFALARTVEYFRIPRSVLVATLGKSTYARCFRGDTRVALVDGTAPTLEEMARRHDSGELFWGYSIGEHGRLIVSQLEAPRFIGRDALVEIELDSGERIHATADHQFMRRDGRLAQAHALRAGNALMPLYRDTARGYEIVYQPIDGHMHLTHRLADEWNLRHAIYAEVAGTHRHHMDFDRCNNRPTNIERMPASEHIRLHNDHSYGEDFDAQAHGAAIRDSLLRRSQDVQWRDHFSDVQSQRAREFWASERYAQIREKLLAARRQPSDATREAHRQAMIRRFSDPAERARLLEASGAALSTTPISTLSRLHAGRVAGGHCHYRHFDRAVVAGHSIGARGRTPHRVQEQLEANGAGRSKPSQHAEMLSQRRMGIPVGRRPGSRLWQQPAGRLAIFDFAIYRPKTNP